MLAVLCRASIIESEGVTMTRQIQLNSVEVG
jgi:hypothetical protein